MAKQTSSTPTKNQTVPDVERGNASNRNMRTPTQSRTSPQDEAISPAGTFETSLTSPSTFDESMRSPTPTKIIFEHNVKTTQGSAARSGAGLLFGMSKPALGIAALLVLGCAAAAAFGWLKIPGLHNQIQDLHKQVQKLSNQIDRLTVENNRYQKLNNELNATAAHLQELNQHLNASVVELEGITGDLNQTNLELSARVTELAAENDHYALLNHQLNDTATNLADQVGFFQAAVTKLVLENGSLSNLTGALHDVTSQLGNLTSSQNKTLTQLYDVMNGLTTQNDRLQTLNNNLVTVVSFLNETSLGLGNSLQHITQFLSSQIVANQVLVAQSLQNSYDQRLANWDCGYRDYFSGKPFVSNYTVIIKNLTMVVDYVDTRLLADICLNKTDFEDYLTQQYPNGVNSYRLTRGVNDYTTAALDYYFPQSGQVGLAPQAWANASYNCQNLAQPFTLS